MQNYKIKIASIFTGQTISLLTSAVVQFALIWYITFKTGSALYLAYATIAGILPQIIIGPFAGVIADRYNRKILMIISDTFVALATLALFIMFSVGEVSILGICIVLAVRSVGSAFHSPSLQSSIPLMVPEDKLVRISGINQTLISLTTILAPVLAGLIYGFWKIEYIVLLDIIGAIIGVAMLVPIKIPRQKVSEGKIKIFKEMKEGFDEIKNSKFLLLISLFVTAVAIIFMPVGSLFPLMTSNYFRLEPFHASIVEAAFSIGMFIGGVIFSIWGGFKKKQYTLLGSMIIFGIGLLASGLIPPNTFYIFVIGSALMGAMAPFYNGIYIAILQLRIAPEKLGRVFSIVSSMMLVATPIGLLVSAPIAEKIGVEKWLVISGVVLLVICFGVLLFKTFRNENWETTGKNSSEVIDT